MYAEHVPIINAAMRASPEVFMRGCMFAVLSARTQFVLVPDQMKCVRKRGEKSPALWNWKFDAYCYLNENVEHIHKLVCNQRDTGAAMALLCAVPGLGIVKGAFVLQMLGHDIACLDVRNVQREGLNPRAYTSHHKTSKRWSQLIAQYVEQTQGRAQELWDVWCHDVAGTYGLSAEKISEMHLTAIVPKSMRQMAPIAPISQQIPF